MKRQRINFFLFFFREFIRKIIRSDDREEERRDVSPIGNTIMAAAHESRRADERDIRKSGARIRASVHRRRAFSMDRMTKLLEVGGVGEDLTRIPSPSLSRLGMLIFRLIPSSTLHFVVLCFPNVGADFSTIDGLYQPDPRGNISVSSNSSACLFSFLFFFLDTDKSLNLVRNLLKVYCKTGIFLYFYEISFPESAFANERKGIESKRR